MVQKVDRSSFFSWVGMIKNDPELLKNIPISFSKRSKFGKTIDAVWLENQLGIPRKAFASDLANEVDLLIEVMIQMGVIGNEKQAYFDWVNNVLNDVDRLWEIPIANATEGDYGFSINKSWLSEQTGIQRKAFTRYEYIHDLNRVIKAMIDKGIILLGETAESNDVRRRLLHWYRNQTNEQKLKIKIRHGKVSIKDLNHMKLFGSLSKNIHAKSVNTAIREISADLRRLQASNLIGENTTGFNYQNSKYFDDLRSKYNQKKLDKSNFTSKIQKKRFHAIDYIVPIKKWLKRVKKNKRLLKSIPIYSKQTNKGIVYQVSKKWFKQAFGGVSDVVYNSNKEQINSVIEIMIQEGLIQDGSSVYIINKRKKISLWFNNLTVEQKLNIPIYSNKISNSFLTSQVGSLPNKEFILNELKIIEDELLRLGLTVPKEEFLTASEKVKLFDKNFKIKIKEISDEWSYLTNTLLDDASKFVKPTIEKPLIQLQHLFAATIHGVEKDSTKRTTINAFNEYVRYIQSNQELEPVYLEKHFNEFTLVYFRNYLEKKTVNGEISESHANGVLSGVRKALSLANNIKGLKLPHFIMEEGFQVIERKTDAYKPFSDEERELINEGIKQDIAKLSKFLVEYQPLVGGGSPLDENLNFKKGCKTLEGCRWIFDNYFGSNFIGAGRSVSHSNIKTVEKKFTMAMSKLGGLHKIYESWGFASKIDSDFLLPYFVRLMQITGLNFQSVIDIDMDSFLENHPASGGRACLRYWKERSTGEKLYVLDIFNASFHWLTTKQAHEVKKCFEEVKYLTIEIRKKAPENIKNRLFIYESNKSIRKFNMRYLFNPIKRMGIRYGVNEGFNLARFRPTFVSELIGMGISIRELQLILGHSSIVTTMGYLDRLDFNKKAREKLQKIIVNIHQKTFLSEDIDDAPVKIKDIPIFKTPLASCRNVFDPPDFVKKLKSYIPGTPCATYNKCLSCDNVIIVKEHLPVLFAMQRDYLDISVYKSVGDTPYGTVIQENLILLNEILNPEFSMFDKEALDEAKAKSYYIDSTVTIDGVGT
ncbi:MAG: site-specific integrase [Methylotenera sp.]|nr:site-specific integrase [Methylotenera sp.]MDP1958644.1 site-specific integrase [Methylotenera sp.]